MSHVPIACVGPKIAKCGAVPLILVLLVVSADFARASETKKSSHGVGKYVLLNLLLATADYESAHAVQHRGGCRESNSVFSPYPSRGRFYGEGLAIDAGPEMLGWLLHRKHVRLWQLPFAVVSAWHVQGLVTNLRCAGP